MSSNTSAETPEEGKRELYEKCRCNCIKHGGTYMHFQDCCNNDGYIPLQITYGEIMSRLGEQASLERENAELKKENARLKAANAVMKRLGTSDEVAETIKRYKSALEQIVDYVDPHSAHNAFYVMRDIAKSALEGTNEYKAKYNGAKPWDVAGWKPE